MSARSTLSHPFVCLGVCAGACEWAVVHPSVWRLFLQCWLAESGWEKWESPLLQWFSTLPFPHRHILTLLNQSRASWMRVQQEHSFKLWRGCTLVPCEVWTVSKFTQGRWLTLPNQISESRGISREEDWGCKKAQTNRLNVIEKEENENKFFICYYRTRNKPIRITFHKISLLFSFQRQLGGLQEASVPLWKCTSFMMFLLQGK